MCCLISIASMLGPRLAILVWYLFRPERWQATFDTWIWPLLGSLFLPWTTLAYVLVARNGIHGPGGGADRAGRADRSGLARRRLQEPEAPQKRLAARRPSFSTAQSAAGAADGRVSRVHPAFRRAVARGPARPGPHPGPDPGAAGRGLCPHGLWPAVRRCRPAATWPTIHPACSRRTAAPSPSSPTTRSSPGSTGLSPARSRRCCPSRPSPGP